MRHISAKVLKGKSSNRYISEEQFSQIACHQQPNRHSSIESEVEEKPGANYYELERFACNRRNVANGGHCAALFKLELVNCQE